MTQADNWATDYLNRFRQMVETLKAHQFVDSVRFWTFEPLSDEVLQEIETHLGYPIDEYVKAFFKQTNGLHLGWYSKLGYGDFDGFEEKSGAAPGTWYVGFDETEQCEGYAAILPLDGIINPQLRLLDEINPYYKREGDIPGSRLHYLDKFESFTDVCIYLNGRSEFGVVFGEDHGAAYGQKDDYSFKEYMEGILRNYCALDGRMLSKPLSIHEIIKDHYENEVAGAFLEKETFEAFGKEAVLKLEQELGIDIRMKFDVFVDEELLSRPVEVETHTSFKAEETDLVRYILSLDKQAFFSGHDTLYSITFDQLKHSLDFSRLLPLEEKMREKEGNWVPLIWLKNLPGDLQFDSLKDSGLQTLYLGYSDQAKVDFGPLENQEFSTIETLWVTDFSDCDNFDFLRSFPRLKHLRLAFFENCILPQDLTYLDQLESLMIWSDKPNQPATELRLPESLDNLTWMMNALTEIPRIDAPNLVYLEIKSDTISRVSNISHLTKLQSLIVKGGITDFDELVNLQPGVKVSVDKTKFITGDKKTDLKRRFALKHLDLLLN